MTVRASPWRPLRRGSEREGGTRPISGHLTQPKHRKDPKRRRKGSGLSFSVNYLFFFFGLPLRIECSWYLVS